MDLDRDGDLDALSASRDDDTVAWHENTAGPSDPGGGACPAGASDNCPADSNASQTNSDAFFAGDVCQCGNVDGAGGIDATDLLRALEYVVGRTLNGAFDVDHCDVNTDAACGVADLFLIERAASGASVTLEDRCDAYTGP